MKKSSDVFGAFCFFLLVALQKTPSLLGAECQGVGTTPLHANERGQNERGQTVRFVAVIEPPVYWGISIYHTTPERRVTRALYPYHWVWS